MRQFTFLTKCEIIAYMQFSQFVKMLSLLGWNKSEFARRAGTTPQTVSRWREQGRCPEWVAGWLEPRVAIAEAYRRLVEVRK